jgi:hypothetical protein
MTTPQTTLSLIGWVEIICNCHREFFCPFVNRRFIALADAIEEAYTNVVVAGSHHPPHTHTHTTTTTTHTHIPDPTNPPKLSSPV